MHKHASDNVLECLGFELSDQDCTRALCQVVKGRAHTEEAETASNLLGRLSNNQTWQNVFCSPAVDGVGWLVEEIASTMHNPKTITQLLRVSGNILGASGENNYASLYVQSDAFSLLRPVCHHMDFSIVLRACICVSLLACDKTAATHPGCAATLEDISEVLQPLTPGFVRANTSFLRSDLPPLLRMLSPDVAPAVQLAGLLRISSAIGQEAERDNVRNVELFQESRPLLVSIRVAASSENPFVYAAAAYVLRSLNHAVPPYNSAAKSKKKAIQSGGVDESALPLAEWDVERVCAWVREQPFKLYGPIFRDGFVNGGVLASVTESDLLELKVVHPLHRRLMLQSIEALVKTNSSAAIAAGGGRAAALALSPETHSRKSSQNQFDAFISYRRVGGEDFAQLLKVQLETAGLTVFLDVENLGQGNFEDQLNKSLVVSKCVVLVWTKGCMDGFLDGADGANENFVRKEYLMAMKFKKPIIPVMHEHFGDIPAADRLPPDTRPILSNNAQKWVSQFRKESLARLLESIKANSV
jgi:hypothetical protein